MKEKAIKQSMNKTAQDSDVIKNPERGKQKPQTPYEPGYRKLGLEPQPLIDKDRQFILANTNINTSAVIDPMAKTFSSFDGKSFADDGDEIDIDGFDAQYIDNNEFVFPEDPFNVPKQKEVEISDTPNVGDYILMVFSKIVCFGNSDKIEKRVEDILYGDDKEFVELAPSKDDIVVLKRVDLKVGVSIQL